MLSYICPILKTPMGFIGVAVVSEKKKKLLVLNLGSNLKVPRVRLGIQLVGKVLAVAIVPSPPS